ncbi:MAG: class III poly(R)-hydroxyalkanoic acid synthase subunit PhaC [Gammaproteobacteria bacterium]
MISMRPDELVNEAVAYQRKLADGVSTLAEMGSIETGVSEKEQVYCEDKLRLFRYKARVENPAKVPVLIIYALVNRPYMTDLQEDRSLVRGLLDEGIDVYLIDWGYPDGADRYLEIDDYLNGYVHNCVEHIKAAHDLEKINILGICQGGTFSTCYAAMHPENVKGLITMVTPIDFKTEDNLLSAWSQDLDVDLMVDTLGNIPGEFLNFAFLSMQPFRLTGQKYVDMVNLLDNPKAFKNFMRMEKWIFDSPDQAGETFRQFIKWMYQENRLVEDKLTIGTREVRLSNLTMPILNVYASADHLVPPAASLALKDKVGSKDYSEVAFRGGHIGIYVSGRAQREVPPAIATWLMDRMDGN